MENWFKIRIRDKHPESYFWQLSTRKFFVNSVFPGSVAFLTLGQGSWMEKLWSGSTARNYRVQLPGRDAVWRLGNRCIPPWQSHRQWEGGRGAELGWEGCPSHSEPAICNRACLIKIKWLERPTANAKVATILSSIPASSGTVEFEVRQRTQCWKSNLKIPQKSPRKEEKKIYLI